MLLALVLLLICTAHSLVMPDTSRRGQGLSLYYIWSGSFTVLIQYFCKLQTYSLGTKSKKTPFQHQCDVVTSHWHDDVCMSSLLREDQHRFDVQMARPWTDWVHIWPTKLDGQLKKIFVYREASSRPQNLVKIVEKIYELPFPLKKIGYPSVI